MAELPVTDDSNAEKGKKKKPEQEKSVVRPV